MIDTPARRRQTPPPQALGRRSRLVRRGFQHRAVRRRGPPGQLRPGQPVASPAGASCAASTTSSAAPRESWCACSPATSGTSPSICGATLRTSGNGQGSISSRSTDERRSGSPVDPGRLRPRLPGSSPTPPRCCTKRPTSTTRPASELDPLERPHPRTSPGRSICWPAKHSCRQRQRRRRRRRSRMPSCRSG